MNIVVFEDAGVEQLFPITTGRPAYAISAGGYRLIDWLMEFEGNLVGCVRRYLERIQLLDFPGLQDQLDPNLRWTLVVNARMSPSHSNLNRLRNLLGDSAPLATEATELRIEQLPRVVRSGWAIAAAVLPTTDLLRQDRSQWPHAIESLVANPETKQTENGIKLLDYPHDVIAENLDCFAENLDYRIQHGGYEQRFPGVHFGRNVELNDPIVFDSSSGPIVIDDQVKIGPFSFFRGPVYIGPRCRISEHASIKDGVSVGHTCKIGGEVEGSVFESYTNKQHHGFLGHSYVGSWINLGAGTCNSDLKNTYGTVNMQYGDNKVSTGMQFIGCVIGDYAKTAINTCIFTGKLIGTASMVYGFATTNVPSFVNYARTFNEVGNLPPEVIVTTQQRMFERRKVSQRPCDIQLVHDMYRVTASERPDDLSDDPLVL